MKTYTEAEMQEKQKQLDAMRDARDIYYEMVNDLCEILKPELGQHITLKAKEVMKERDEWHTLATNLSAEKMKSKP